MSRENLRCGLCHHRCSIPPGGRGFCGARAAAESGELSLPYHGYITALALDPIEKKPLYHFRPGSQVLSLGFAGCNLRCPFCQNWHISQLKDGAPPGRLMDREAVLASLPQDGGPGQIAYTYSEPLIHLEYLKDCMELAHERGLANVLVSNGCLNPEGAAEILPLVDAANIDLKCFSESSYREILGGDLETVLNFIRAAARQGVRLEITTLVVPGFNDSDAELDRCAEFIAALGPEAPIPWHLSAYHPAYRWDAPPTEGAALRRAAERARKILPWVYTGNIAGEESSTRCRRCGAVLVRRRAYRVESFVLPAAAGEGPPFKRPRLCPSCGAETPIYC